MAKNDTLKYRVGQVEKDQKHLIKKVDKIRTNDIPHLHQAIKVQGVDLKGKYKSLDTKIKLAVGVNVIQVVALVVGVILLLKR